MYDAATLGRLWNIIRYLECIMAMHIAVAFVESLRTVEIETCYN